MRLRLKPDAGPRGAWVWLGLLLVAAFTLLQPALAEADDRVVLRGNYYREDSTRVLQPMVSFSKDLPDERLTVGVDYLLDSISSASIGAGSAQLGGDFVFTEIRHETSARVGSKLGPWGLGGYFRYSTETDFEARSFGFNVSREFLEKTVTLSASYSAGFDSAYRIMGQGRRAEWKSLRPAADGSFENASDTNLVQSHYGSVGYSHVLTKRLLAGLNLEVSGILGPQENPYRSVINGYPEAHPLSRIRFAPSVFAYYSIPKTPLVAEGRYRFYGDTWGITAHAIDLRLHLRLWKYLRLRARYRYYTQTGSDFFVADLNYDQSERFKTADPKMSAFRSHMPGGEITVELTPLAQFDGLAWLDGAFIQATYNHLFQTNRFGNARIGALTFSLPF